MDTPRPTRGQAPIGLRWAVVDRSRQRVAWCRSRRQALAIASRGLGCGQIASHDTIVAADSQHALEDLLGLSHRETRVAGRWTSLRATKWWRDPRPAITGTSA